MDLVKHELNNLKTCYNGLYGNITKDEKNEACKQFGLAVARVAALATTAFALFAAIVTAAGSPFAPQLLITALLFCSAAVLTRDLYVVARNVQERTVADDAKSPSEGILSGAYNKGASLINEIAENSVLNSSKGPSLWRDLTVGTLVLKHIPLSRFI